ncbi:MAG: hypothetical protein HKN36_04080 [Hellea sp.]|nr:hypothetical protein [Hellea sp.]
MRHYEIYSTLLAIISLAACPLAWAGDQPAELLSTQEIAVDSDQVDVQIALDTNLLAVNSGDTNIGDEQLFQRRVEPAIEYDLAAKLDANFGVIPVVDEHQILELPSGALPEGRYIAPIRSKFGAGISRKF